MEKLVLIIFLSTDTKKDSESQRKYKFVELNRSVRCNMYKKNHNHSITKTYLHNFDPIKAYFHIVKQEYILFFFLLLKNIDCGYPLEPPPRGGSNEYPLSMFWAEIYKVSEFLPKKFLVFLVWNFPMYLNRPVFVMEHSLPISLRERAM